MVLCVPIWCQKCGFLPEMWPKSGYLAQKSGYLALDQRRGVYPLWCRRVSHCGAGGCTSGARKRGPFQEWEVGTLIQGWTESKTRVWDTRVCGARVIGVWCACVDSRCGFTGMEANARVWRQMHGYGGKYTKLVGNTPNWWEVSTFGGKYPHLVGNIHILAEKTRNHHILAGKHHIW